MHLQRIFSISALILGISLAIPVIIGGVLALLLFLAGISDFGLPNVENLLPKQSIKR